MARDVTVKVVHNGTNRLAMYYNCPRSGRRKWKSLKTTDEDEAKKLAWEWERDLRATNCRATTEISWDGFRSQYEEEAGTTLEMAGKTCQMVNTVFNLVERICRPKRLDELDEDRLAYFRTKLREGRSDATARTYMAHLMSALQWAVDSKMLHSKPTLPRARRKKKARFMKGSPVTNEQFRAMLDNVCAGLLAANAELKRRPTNNPISAIVREKLSSKRNEAAAAVAESWRKLLIGLWLSGLRLGESLNLFWDGDRGIRIKLTGRRPWLHIPAECDKGSQDRVYPLTPDFAEWLLRTPKEDRHGPVFRPRGLRGEACHKLRWVSRVISAIGKAAAAKVRDDDGVIKHASAHDLRRAFGTRWAPKVMPATLMALMRHESIETTMRYYVGLQADVLAEELWTKYATPDAAVNDIVNLVLSSASEDSAREKPQVLAG